ncbi:MAG: SurA N-terminal domain-containing protein [Bacteroidia bacterium]|nr:SurA N-terminal domain-containing protein [Bacteroidia bacterium]
MATLQKIRDKGVLLVTIIGIALLAFILGDLLTSGNTLFMRSRDKAFVVNRQIISTQEYADRITEWESFQKMVSGQTSLDENTTQQIREAVYDQMVRERMLDNQAAKLGLTVSKEEINDLVHGEAISPLLQQLPFFLDPQTGMFDREGLVQFLSTVNTPVESLQPEERAVVEQYRQIWLFIENMIKYQRLQEKYTSLLTGAVLVNDVEAKNTFELSQQSADVAYVMKSYFTIPDSAVTVTDQEIRSFYDKNKDAYRMDVPMAKLTYFTKEIIPSDEDFAEIEAQSNEAYRRLVETDNPAAVVADYSDMPFRDIYLAANSLTEGQQNFVESASVSEIKGPVREGDSYNIYKLIDRTMAPDSVHLRMMAIPDASMMGQDSIVTHFVDSIYNEITGGLSFAEVANSLNPQSNGGDVGWAREVDLVQVGPEMVQAVFSAPVGQPQRIKIPGQQVIFQVEERTAPVQKFKIATIHMPVIVSEKTSNNVDNELNQFVSDPNVSKNFNELATEKGYAVMPDARVSANDFTLMQIPGTRQVVTWAVNESKMGTVRKFDITNMRVIARVDRVYPAGTAPLSEVSSSIRARLVNDKKAEQVISDLSAKNLTGLDAYAAEMQSNVDTVKFVNFSTQNISGLGFEPALNAISAFAPLNSITAPVRGNMGVYVANVLNRTQGTEEYNADEQKTMMQSNNAYVLQMQAMEMLKRKLKVEDNRYVFF